MKEFLSSGSALYVNISLLYFPSNIVYHRSHIKHIFGLYPVYYLSYCIKMGGIFGKSVSSKHCLPESKLEAKMVEAIRQKASKGSAIKSFNSIILKFPKIDESLRNCKAIFDQFDEDSNGMIDPEELKCCFHKLEISCVEEEISDLFKACDLTENMGMKFNEFIVLLCLVYLLKEPAALQERGPGHILQNWPLTTNTMWKHHIHAWLKT